MKQSTGIANTGLLKEQSATSEADIGLSEQVTSLAEPRPTESDNHTPDGSIGYRIAALVAMLLLALAALGIWFYFRG